MRRAARPKKPPERLEAAPARAITPTADPIGWYFARGLLSRGQHESARWWYALTYRALGSGYAAVNLDSFHGCASYADNWRFTWAKAEAQQVRIQVARLMPPEAFSVLDRVAWQGAFAIDAARALRRPSRQGIALLRQGLDVVDQYRSHRLAPHRAELVAATDGEPTR
jgi:hypothetical protein